MFQSDRVDVNGIIGAVCIYLMIGVLWSLFYVFVNLIIPGSFSVPITGSAFDQQHKVIYFSFVTLTSLGYGDFTPVSATARALAAIEVMLGQFYMTILVAGLVAVYMMHRER